MKFCQYCGRRLENDEACDCPESMAAYAAQKLNRGAFKAFWENMKNRMGIGDPELNKTDAFEKDLCIVPDCSPASENERPIKQYVIAKLRNRLFGITYAKAVGKLQVTNKRVIFRAPGRFISWRTTAQQEFSLREIAGIESRRELAFSFWNFYIGSLVTLIGGAVVTGLINLLCMRDINAGKYAGLIVSALLVGIAGCVPFFILKKKWLLKLLCLGASFLPLFTCGRQIESDFGTKLFNFFGVVSLAFALFVLFIYAVKPNLVLEIKTKVGTEVIAVKRKLIALNKTGNTGYQEVEPTVKAEICIRELNAIIQDVQELGDSAVEKWQA